MVGPLLRTFCATRVDFLPFRRSQFVRTWQVGLSRVRFADGRAAARMNQLSSNRARLVVYSCLKGTNFTFGSLKNQ